MRPFFVVTDLPLCTDLLHLLQRLEEIGIEDFGPIGAIEAFDEGILFRCPRQRPRPS